MNNLLRRIQSANWGLMLLCALVAPFIGTSQIDFQVIKEINSIFPDSGMIETADVDNDGDVDILSMGRDSRNTIFEFKTNLLLNDGSGNFSVVENTPFDGCFSGEADFGDVDSDGDLDVIIVGQTEPSLGTGKLYLNQGNAVFTVAEPNPFPGLRDAEVEFFDLNGDLHLDVLLAGSNGSILMTKIFIGDGKGNFVEKTDQIIEGLRRADASFGDIDGDGDEDFIASGQAYPEYWDVGAKIYINEFGKLIKKPEISDLYGGDSELADFDHDGDLDYLNIGQSYNGTKMVDYFLNDGAGNFTKILDHSFIPVTMGAKIVVEDFDLDGDLDVYISGADKTALQNYLYLNDGTGSFTINNYRFPVTKDYGSGVGDFDGKGLYDFLFFGEVWAKCRIFYNNIDLNEAPVINGVEVTGPILVGQEVIGSYIFQDKEGDQDHSSFQWYIADDASGTNKTVIEGAVQKNYLINTPDEGKYLSLEITPNDGKLQGLVVQSEWLGPVAVPLPNIMVSGNSISIVNGSTETSIEDHTHFGGIKITGSISRTFTLGNNGKADLIIEDILLLGENGEDFSLITPDALPIVPGETKSLTLQFSPLTLGNRTAVVSIISNDQNNSPFTFHISGEGLNSPPQFSSAPDVEIQENLIGLILDINATDGEGGVEDENISYAISGGEDKDLFLIDSNTGGLTFISSPDHENARDSNKDNVYLIEITAYDGGPVDNSAVQLISVTVSNVDELPIAVCKEVITVTIGTDGTATINAEEFGEGSIDDMGIAEWKVEPNIFNCNNIGTVTITLTVKDSGGQSASCSTTITVTDDIIPVISFVVPVKVDSEVGKCNASIQLTPPLVLDNCGSWNAIGTRSDGLALEDPFPIGNTIITWRTDATGLGEDVEQVITVQDSEAPVITAALPIQRNTDLGKNGAFVTVDNPAISDCSNVELSGVRSDNFGLNDIFPVGETLITWTATDGTNTALPVFQKVIVLDVERPTISGIQDISINSRGGNCGSFVNIVPPTVSDNCGVAGPAVGHREDNLSLGDFFPVGETKIKWTAIDVNNNEAIAVYQTVSVQERQPDEIIISGPEGPRIIGTAIEMTAGFMDENYVEAKWKILDGGVILEESIDNFFAPETKLTSQSFENLPAGVYTVSLDLKYDCGKVVTKNFEYVVIYDPNGGFVTGGGWIYSPAGAMREQGKLLIEGRASFGFNAKYKSGKNELDQVDGETNFQFRAGDLYFKSSSHQAMSLVVSGGFKATYKGLGVVNGEEGYNFMVTVIDADETENYLIDLFRIKIWKGGTLIYDNNIKNEGEDADPVTTIGGGSIVIHKPNSGNKTSTSGVVQLDESETSGVLEVFSAYPNPMESGATIEFRLTTTTNAILSLYDLNGREVQRLFDGKADKGITYKIEVLKNNIMGGIYLYRLTTGLGKIYQKQLVVK